MATILKGAPVVAAMNEANAARCAAMQEKGIVPTLAVVRVGARPDDLSYEKGVLTRCSKVGVAVKQFLLPEDAAQDALLEVIRQINADPSIHGCLLFRPLPRQFDDRAVRAALAEGQLSQTRYDSYCAMYDEVKDVKDWQRPKF